MEMFLMALCLSLLGVTVSAIAFSAATHPTTSSPAAVKAPRPGVPVPQFFAGETLVTPESSRVPIEVLLLQIDRHVRLEQAAAEAFHAFPNAESLHSRTTSPLIH
jgi:hypothetical protein